MLSNIFFGIGFVFAFGYGWGFLSKQEFKTNTNLRIIVHWFMALGFFLVHEVNGIHLIYTFPLGIALSFLGIKLGIRSEPTTVLIVSAIVWSFFLMTISNIFGTFV